MKLNLRGRKWLLQGCDNRVETWVFQLFAMWCTLEYALKLNVLLWWHFINKNNKQGKEINAKTRALITDSKEAKLWKGGPGGAEPCCRWKSLCVLFCLGRGRKIVFSQEHLVRKEGMQFSTMFQLFKLYLLMLDPYEILWGLLSLRVRSLLWR